MFLRRIMCLLLLLVIAAATSLPPPPRLPGGPVPFLEVLNDKVPSFRLTDEGKILLSSIPPGQPPALLSVIGRNACGKSYLLNQLLGRLPGEPAFLVNDSLGSTTRGVVAWSPPPCLRGGSLVAPSECRDGDRRLIIWDTQGLHAVDIMSTGLDQSLFSIGLLTSTVLVYNIGQKIDSDNLLELAGVVALSELIDSGRDNSLVGFPALVIVGQSAPESQQGELTSYLNELLGNYTGGGTTLGLRVAETLQRFSSLSAVGLPPPVLRSSLNSRLPELPPSQLSTKYVEAVNDLRGQVFSLLSESPLPSRSHSAAALESFLTGILNLLRDHPMPEPGELSETLRESALDTARAQFAAQARERLGVCADIAYGVDTVPSGGLYQCKPLTQQEAVAAASAISARVRSSDAVFYADGDSLGRCLADLEAKFVADNQRASYTVCESALSDALQSLGETAATLQEFRALETSVAETFAARCRGPALTETLHGFEAKRLRVQQQAAFKALTVALSTCVTFLLVLGALGLFFQILPSSWLVSVAHCFITLSACLLSVAIIIFAMSRFSQSSIGIQLLLIIADLFSTNERSIGAVSIVLVVLLLASVQLAKPPTPVSTPKTRRGHRKQKQEQSTIVMSTYADDPTTYSGSY